MGLDSVEIVIATEEEFGIKISNADVEKIVTMGEFTDLVYETLSGVSVERDRQLKDALDDGFQRVIGRKISELPLDTKVRDLLTPGKEVSQWKKLGVTPRAKRPAWAIILAAQICVLLGILVANYLVPDNVYVLMGFLLLSIWLTSIVSGPFAKLPKNDVTIGDQVWWSTEARKDPLSRSEVFEKLSKIVGDQLGVEEEKITENTRFVEDFGMD